MGILKFLIGIIFKNSFNNSIFHQNLFLVNCFCFVTVAIQFKYHIMSHGVFLPLVNCLMEVIWFTHWSYESLRVG